MPAAKKIIVSVSNDLYTDMRVHKTCMFLHEKGNEVLLVGRLLKNSGIVNDRPYTTKRFKLLFNKGPLFYASLNIRLFFFLLFKKYDVLVSNDLDTLPANYYAKRLRRNKKLVYDTHEIFTEVPELINSGIKRKIWLWFERRIFPRLEHICTVNESIAAYYQDKYGKVLHVVRNIPAVQSIEKPTRQELDLPENKKILIIQGAGINMHRGNEEMVQSMEFLNEDYLLLIIGNGDVLEKLKLICREKKLENKIIFLPKMPYKKLIGYTANADLGVTVDKDTNLNYKYSLPNKLFDFIHAGIPVMASNLVEVKKIVTTYDVGKIIPSHQPEAIAQTVQSIFSDHQQYISMKRNCEKAREILNWENEKKNLEKLYAFLNN